MSYRWLLNSLLRLERSCLIDCCYRQTFMTQKRKLPRDATKTMIEESMRPWSPHDTINDYSNKEASRRRKKVKADDPQWRTYKIHKQPGSLETKRFTTYIPRAASLLLNMIAKYLISWIKYCILNDFYTN